MFEYTTILLKLFIRYHSFPYISRVIQNCSLFFSFPSLLSPPALSSSPPLPHFIHSSRFLLFHYIVEIWNTILKFNSLIVRTVWTFTSVADNRFFSTCCFVTVHLKFPLSFNINVSIVVWFLFVLCLNQTNPAIRGLIITQVPSGGLVTGIPSGQEAWDQDLWRCTGIDRDRQRQYIYKYRYTSLVARRCPAKERVSKKRKQRLAECNRFYYPFDISHRQSPPHIIIISLAYYTLLASSI